MDVSKQYRSSFNTFSEEFELKFYEVFSSFKKLGCDYFYFLGVDSGFSYRFCSNENWLDLYYEEKLILNDPLKRMAEKNNFIALPWSQVTHSNLQDKKTIQGRKSFGLHNGITLTRKRNSRKYIFSLSTEEIGHDLARYLLIEKSEMLQKFILSSMNLFDEYLLVAQK